VIGPVDFDMREIVQKVMAAEAEAKATVAAARREKERILAAAQRQAQELLATARGQARAEAVELLAAANHAAQLEKQARLARTASELATQASLDDETRRGVVEAAVRCVCGLQEPGAR
jgi:vacuolar-type H+-ATPase subunit H